jgi:RimJ/RimL family protein N-acetyltransferase
MAHPIRFGIRFGQQNIEWARLLDFRRQVDGWGDDSLWTFDHRPWSVGGDEPGGVLFLRTERLVLRNWRAADLEPFARLNADPRVMEHFPALLKRAESDVLAARIRAHLEERGFGLWAVEVCGVTPFAGFIGLSVPSFEAHFTPCVEVGWRLAAELWGRGYATEGARAALDFGFGRLELGEIVSFTVPANLRSRQVMERLGMRCSPNDDFEHPELPTGHALRRHVLYRVARAGRERDAARGEGRS